MRNKACGTEPCGTNRAEQTARNKPAPIKLKKKVEKVLKKTLSVTRLTLSRDSNPLATLEVNSSGSVNGGLAQLSKKTKKPKSRDFE